MQGKNIKIIDKNSVYISDQTIIDDDVTIYPNNYFEGKCVIKKGAIILPNNFIKDSTIGENVKVFSSVIEDSQVGDGATIGPFAHLRPKSIVGCGVKIGSFVEIKNSRLGEKTKVPHLSYVGDVEMGKKVNVGCGVVFVNYNGKIKQKTVVGDNSFIGSSVNLIAPLKVGERTFICAGTTVDKDVDSGDFVIGRSKMCIKKDRAKNYLKGED